MMCSRQMLISLSLLVACGPISTDTGTTSNTTATSSESETDTTGTSEGGTTATPTTTEDDGTHGSTSGPVSTSEPTTGESPCQALACVDGACPGSAECVDEVCAVAGNVVCKPECKPLMVDGKFVVDPNGDIVCDAGCKPLGCDERCPDDSICAEDTQVCLNGAFQPVCDPNCTPVLCDLSCPGGATCTSLGNGIQVCMVSETETHLCTSELCPTLPCGAGQACPAGTECGTVWGGLEACVQPVTQEPTCDEECELLACGEGCPEGSQCTDNDVCISVPQGIPLCLGT